MLKPNLIMRTYQTQNFSKWWTCTLLKCQGHETGKIEELFQIKGDQGNCQLNKMDPRLDPGPEKKDISMIICKI